MACKDERWDEALDLIAAGAVSSSEYGGGTALCYAAEGGNVAVIERLLTAGARLESGSSGALHKACAARRYPAAAVKALLAAGADVAAVNEAGQTPLHVAASRYDKRRAELAHEAELDELDGISVWDGSDTAELLEALLAAGASVTAVDSRRRTALHYAAKAANEESARVLIAAGSDVGATDSLGHTPLDRLRWHWRDPYDQGYYWVSNLEDEFKVKGVEAAVLRGGDPMSMGDYYDILRQEMRDSLEAIEMDHVERAVAVLRDAGADVGAAYSEGEDSDWEEGSEEDA